jgi:hypothetical protein
MKSEQIKEITEKATEQLVAALQKGHSETLTNYLKTIGRFHRYSLHNVLLIALQKRESCVTPRFRQRSICTRRKTAMKHGRRKGNI